jgi:hypothetical protein
VDEEIAVEGTQITEWPHGTNRCYTAGCHCDECKAAHARYMKEWRGPPDSAIERIVKRAGKLTPEQIELLRSVLPDPGDEQRSA